MAFLSRPPRRRLVLWAVGVLALVLATPRLRRENLFSTGGETKEARPFPPLPDAAQRIGPAPRTSADLAGRVWVVKVWTFGCINCLRSIPYANGLVERLGPEVGVLGIHSPEFDWERDPVALEEALREHDVRFANLVDASLELFLALEAPAWPAFYVVDREMQIRGEWFGEMHEGTLRAREMEALIRRLIRE